MSTTSANPTDSSSVANGDDVWRNVTDRDEWNRFVLALPHCDMRQGFEWGEVRGTQGWRPHRVAVLRNGRCVGAASLLERRVSGLGLSVLYAPGGPLFADPEDVAAWGELINGIRAVASRTGAVFVRVTPKISNEANPLHPGLVAHGFVHLPDEWTTWNDPRVIMTIDLTADEAEMRKRMFTRARQYLGRAVKRGATVGNETTPDAIRDFQAFLVTVAAQKKLPIRGLDFFEALRREYLERGQGCLILARHGNRLLGGALAVRFGDVAYFLYAGVDTESEARNFHAGPSIYWEMMLWAKAAGCRSLDMGGSATHFPPREDEPGYGVYFFKLGFGAVLGYMAGYYDLPFRPLYYRLFGVAERRLLPMAWSLRGRFNR